MKAQLLLLLLSIGIGQALAAQREASAPEVIVAKQDAELKLQLQQDLSSATAKAGDMVQFTLVNDLVVQGRVIATKGAIIPIRIKHAHPARVNQSCTVFSDGWIQFVEPTLQIGSRARIPLDDENKEGRKSDDSRGFPWGYVLTAVLAPIELPIAAFWLAEIGLDRADHPSSHSSNVPPCEEQPKEAVFQRGTVMTYYVKHDVRLRSAQFPLSAGPAASQ